MTKETLKKFIVSKWTFKERNDLLTKMKLFFEEFIRWRFYFLNDVESLSDFNIEMAELEENRFD